MIMYFITNNENYIVAASKDFLEQSGSRDLCAIASSFKDGTIKLDNESGLFQANSFSEELMYKATILYSSFGNLTLHILSEKKLEIEREDEDISYLKQIKDGAIKTTDNEFSIPIIATIDKKSKSKKELATKELSKSIALENQSSVDAEEIKTALINQESIPEEKSETTSETIHTDKEIEEPTISVADIKVTTDKKEIEEPTVPTQEQSYETIKLFGNTDSDDSIDVAAKESIKLFDYSDTPTDERKESNSNETQKPNNEEKLDTIENIDSESSEHAVPKNIEIAETNKEIVPDVNKIAPEAKDELHANKSIYLEENTSDSEEESSPLRVLDEKQLTIEKRDEAPKEKIIEIPTPVVKETKVKKSGINRLKEKLFPWGSKLNEEIELEEKNSDEFLITASDLESSEKNESLETTPIEKSEEEIRVENILTPVEKIEKSEEIILEKVEKIEKKSDEELSLEDALTNLTEKESTKETSTIESNKSIGNELESAKIDFKENILDENRELSLEAQELEQLKEIHGEKQEQKQEPLDNDITEKHPEELKLHKSVETDNMQLFYKLIHMQVEGINFKQNAKDLNIDGESYKMLLDNYLDELDNYREDLVNGSKSTISMLADAGDLLSLPIISKKLNELLESSKKNQALKELTLLESLLRDKLKGATNTATLDSPSVAPVALKEAPKPPEETKEEEITIAHPNEIVAIDTAESLLENVTKRDISFDPEKAANDLNLPSSLILEFVDDFIVQSKEHLSQMIKAFKERDLKTLQTTAHMLKGAASNLRIDALSENLFRIQKLQSIDSSETLLKEFVAKLKGLESEVKSIESKNNEN